MASDTSPLGAWKTLWNEMGSSALTVASEGHEGEGSLEPLQRVQTWVRLLNLRSLGQVGTFFTLRAPDSV